ncbi:RNA polymerase sigma-70 factor (ECF subfamily) [Mycobacterium frederiksbergense]|uniref:RNA polymerase sigma factor n=1 Tax=Mycolicibacterium frederiksbergense TaxID=117567 RepID=A0ABT6L8R3_9MYCO|nr:sigma-70 family RNA polymerase sigma factor [Mycolicibacterium frederiksbergense]MDH6198617.1 RNA polymerase sigma-70 factor (ECF subfamily) [Mycolicibacterium frederiksbergense]
MTDRAARFVAEALPHLEQIQRGARRVTTSKYDAEDLVQETLLKAYSGFHTYRPDSNIRAWLFRIMYNTWTAGYRSRQRRPNEVLCDEFNDWQLSAEQNHTSTGLRSAEIEALERMQDDAIVHALNAIPPANRLTVFFADVEGYQYREIASLMDTPIGTVMSRLHRGRSRLRELLSDVAAERGIGRADRSAIQRGDSLQAVAV